MKLQHYFTFKFPFICCFMLKQILVDPTCVITRGGILATLHYSIAQSSGQVPPVAAWRNFSPMSLQNMGIGERGRFGIPRAIF